MLTKTLGKQIITYTKHRFPTHAQQVTVQGAGNFLRCHLCNPAPDILLGVSKSRGTWRHSGGSWDWREVCGHDVSTMRHVWGHRGGTGGGGPGVRQRRFTFWLRPSLSIPNKKGVQPFHLLFTFPTFRINFTLPWTGTHELVPRKG